VNDSRATSEARTRLAELIFSGTNVFPKAPSGASQPPVRAHLEAVRDLVAQATEYCERRGDLTALSEALDAQGLLDSYLGNSEMTLSVARRRLSLPALPPEEYIDAINVAAYVNLMLGEFQQALDLGKAACARARTDLPLPHLSRTLSALAIAAFLSGHWEEIDALLPLLDAIREQVAPDAERAVHLGDAYGCVLFVAQARESEAECERLATVLRSLLPGERRFDAERSFLEALLQDDPQLMPVEPLRRDYLHLLYRLRLYSEHDLSAPEPLLSSADQLQRESRSALLAPYLAIAQALATRNLQALEQAIDEAEAAGHSVHAARMRLVLAQRSSDRQQTERARPVLERLGDRRALRRLAEIDHLLARPVPAERQLARGAHHSLAAQAGAQTRQELLILLLQDRSRVEQQRIAQNAAHDRHRT
jgi:hypothetical protein